MSTKRLEVYKCKICGLVVEVLEGGSAPSCCDEPMTLQKANSVDAAQEKHVPVLEKHDSGGVLVKVGSVPHPMTEEHYIQWIEVINGSYVNRYYLKPGQLPQAAFHVASQPGLEVRAYCNLHGLWKKAE